MTANPTVIAERAEALREVLAAGKQLSWHAVIWSANSPVGEGGLTQGMALSRKFDAAIKRFEETYKHKEK